VELPGEERRPVVVLEVEEDVPADDRRATPASE
jgi:hypothetical protein